MSYLTSKAAIALAIAGLMLTGCKSSNDDEPDTPQVPDTPQTETPTGEYGLDATAVRAYFSSKLTDKEATFTGGENLSSDNLDAAEKYVWDLWKTSVQRYITEKLPSINSHYNLTYWDDITSPDGTWTLPEGSMNFFYGSKGSKPADGYPLILFLHGSGDDAQGEWTTCLAWAQIFKDGETAYFMPRSPQGGTGCRWYQPSRQAKWEQLFKYAFVGSEINTDKMYIAGISEGAYGTQRLASFYADYLAGAGPIAGGEELSNVAMENLANIAYCMQTGELDTSYARNILTQNAGKILDDLQASHPDKYVHKVDLQPDKAHACNYTVTTPWLVNYTRDAHPKYVYWENLGLGGINNEPVRYRDGFYNLAILEPSVDRTDVNYRAAYEMNITGNTVELTVNNVTVTSTETVSQDGWTMNTNVKKTYTPATTGKVRIYLSNDLVDLSSPVVVKVNGVEQFNAMVEPSSRHMVESCALYFDSERVFPAAVDVTIGK